MVATLIMPAWIQFASVNCAIFTRSQSDCPLCLLVVAFQNADRLLLALTLDFVTRLLILFPFNITFPVLVSFLFSPLSFPFLIFSLPGVVSGICHWPLPAYSCYTFTCTCIFNRNPFHLYSTFGSCCFQYLAQFIRALLSIHLISFYIFCLAFPFSARFPLSFILPASTSIYISLRIFYFLSFYSLFRWFP